jgi:hypothetical protein
MSIHSSVSITHLLFKVCTLFLTREAHEGVRFLMRQSLCTPKNQQGFIPQKNSCQSRVEIANNVSCTFDKRSAKNIGAMNRGTLSDPSFIGSFKRPLMKKEAPRKMDRGSFKRPLMKKEAPHKMQRGYFRRPPMKKEAPLKTQRVSCKGPPMKKRNPAECKEATSNAKCLMQKTSDEKEAPHRTQRGYLKQLLFETENAQRAPCNKTRPSSTRLTTYSL